MEEKERWVRGFKVEEMMKKMFKGKSSPYDEVDFETSTTLYEVKSCKLFNKLSNPDRFQHGRFFIQVDNHILLYLRAVQSSKQAKYIFVLRVGRQFVFKVLPWNLVYIENNSDQVPISIQEIFGSEVYL